MTKNSSHSVQIDSLTVARGLFAWWVVGFHLKEWVPIDGTVSNSFVQFLKSGYLGVDFFFVLSGFVIFRRYGSEFKSITYSGTYKFLLLRLARIYPLHLFLLIFMLLDPVALLLFSKQGAVSGQYPSSYFIQSVFLVQNWGWADGLSWNVPAWSISTEMLAYLFFPAFAALVGLDKTKTGVFTWLIFTLILVALASFFLTNNYHSIGEGVVRTGAVRCVFEFCLGCCIANVVDKRASGHSNDSRRFAWIAIFLAIAILWLSTALNLKNFLYIPLIVSLGILGMALMAIENSRIPVWLVLLGNISYSTYLCHWIVKSWFIYLNLPKLLYASALIALYCLVVLLASIALYRLVEIPAQRFLQKRIRRSEVFSGVSS